MYPYALATCIAVHSTNSALCAGCLVSGHYSAFSAVIAWLTQRPQACLNMGRYLSDSTLASAPAHGLCWWGVRYCFERLHQLCTSEGKC